MADEPAAAHDRGVTVKLSLWTDDDRGALPDESELSGVCTEARYRDIPSPFVVIVDRTSTSFAPNQGSTNEYGVLVSDRTYTFVFHWFFLTALWESWETVYTERTADSTRTYVDIRYCVRDLETLLNEGATVTVTVRGYETETNEPRAVEGVVTDVTYSGINGVRPATPAFTPLRARLAHRRYRLGAVDVGGWGAVLEEMEAETITIDDVRYE